MGNQNTVNINTDYRDYVGGAWDLMGQWQMDFLQSCPEFNQSVKFLDVGCGSMRLGRHLIPYLDAHCYTGIDRCQEIVEAGIENECDKEIFYKKHPRFIYTDNFCLRGCDDIDFIWASAVFNHLNTESLKNCLNQLNTVCKPDTVLYFTYWEGTKNHPESDVYDGISKRDFYRTQTEICDILTDCDWSGVQLKQKQCRGQSIVRATRRQDAS